MSELPPAPPPPPPPPLPLPSDPDPDHRRSQGHARNNHVAATVASSSQPCWENKVVLDHDSALAEARALVEKETLFRHGHGHDGGMSSDSRMCFVPLLKPLLQNGPVCGIIAIAEAAQILDKDLAPDPDDILVSAKACGFTRNGELFSAKDVQILAEKVLKVRAILVSGMKDRSKNSSQEDPHLLLLGHLSQGKPALIPYDADYNHGPACRKGHAAHWAILHGVVFLGGLGVGEGENTCSWNPSESDLSNLYLRQPDALYVLAHHGKSSKLQMWPYCDLVRSNENLVEIAPKIINADKPFLTKNIGDELANFVILVDYND